MKVDKALEANINCKISDLAQAITSYEDNLRLLGLRLSKFVRHTLLDRILDEGTALLNRIETVKSGMNRILEDPSKRNALILLWLLHFSEEVLIMSNRMRNLAGFLKLKMEANCQLAPIEDNGLQKILTQLDVAHVCIGSVTASKFFVEISFLVLVKLQTNYNCFYRTDYTLNTT